MAQSSAVYPEYYGCPSNRSDYEFMLGILSQQGYRISDRIDDSDVLLINTCAVKKATEDRMEWRIRQLSLTGKPLVIAGCLPRIDLPRIREAAPNFSAILDPYSIDRISSALEDALAGRTGACYFRDHPPSKLKLPKRRVNRYLEVVQISEGCLGHCTYCCTRFARGGLTSYPIGDVVERVEKAVLEGVKEIQLTAQDTGAYGLDRGSSLIELLERLLEIPGRFKIRLGMMNPDHAHEYVDFLKDVYRGDKIYRFIHLPLQSGSQTVLNHMQRDYTVEEFEETVGRLRADVADITLATDLIVGYPKEDEDDFEKTLSIVKRVRPEVVNISKYGRRPGTQASLLEELPVKTLTQRSRSLHATCSRISFEKNLKMVGRGVEVLFTEVSRGGSLTGRSDAYRKVLVDAPASMLGKSAEVMIKGCASRHLEGTLSSPH